MFAFNLFTTACKHQQKHLNTTQPLPTITLHMHADNTRLHMGTTNAQVMLEIELEDVARDT